MTNAIAIGLVFGMVIPATAYPILYGLRTQWYKSAVGRALFIQSVGFMLLIDISSLYQIFGDNYPGRDQVKLLVFLIILGGLWYVLLAFIRIQFWSRPGPDDRYTHDR